MPETRSAARRVRRWTAECDRSRTDFWWERVQHRRRVRRQDQVRSDASSRSKPIEDVLFDEKHEDALRDEDKQMRAGSEGPIHRWISRPALERAFAEVDAQLTRHGSDLDQDAESASRSACALSYGCAAARSQLRLGSREVTVQLPRSTPSAQGIDPAGVDRLPRRDGRRGRHRAAQPDDHPARARRRRGLVGAVRSGSGAPALLAEQELHLDRGRLRGGRGPAGPRRARHLVLPGVRRRHHRSAQPLDAGPPHRGDGQRAHPGDARAGRPAAIRRSRCAGSC